MASHITGETYPPAQIVQNESHVPSMEEYNRLYKQSIEEPDAFWGDIASQFYWKSKWSAVHSMLKYNFDITKDRISIEWLKGAVTNICYNCLDKHINQSTEDKIAFYWLVYYRSSISLYYRVRYDEFFITLQFWMHQN